MRACRVVAVLVAGVLGSGGCTAGPAEMASTPAGSPAGIGAQQQEEAVMRIGPSDPAEVVEFQVALRVPGRADLDRFLAQVHDPASPEYREYLSPERFAARFGLPDDAVAGVVEWLERAGLEVVGRDAGRTFLSVRGRVADVNALFRIELVDYVDEKLGAYHAPEGEPRIDASVQDAVAGVAGLDTLPHIRPMFVPPLADVPIPGMRPRDGALAYDYAPLHDAGITGEGQTIAIVSFDSFMPSDVAAFDREVGITGPPVEQRPVPDDYVPEVGPGSDEVNLDIDVIRAIAPAAQIIDYEAATSTGFVPVIAAILDDARADIVSISWGGCEIDYPEVARALVDIQLDRAFAQGVSIFAASGDTGAFSCAHHRDEADERLSTVYPSVSPSVVSVGGTFLWVREDGSYLREAAWEWSLRKVATGGGPSSSYPRPEWQVAPGIDTASGAFRQTPDVAGPADPESGYVTVYTPFGETAPVIGAASGTSAAAPFWAGSMILARQLAEREGAGPLGALGPLLYQLASTEASPPLFHDVTLGGNLLEAAGPGWDAATGLGSPDVTALANAIVEALR